MIGLWLAGAVAAPGGGWTPRLSYYLGGELVSRWEGPRCSTHRAAIGAARAREKNLMRGVAISRLILAGINLMPAQRLAVAA